MKTTRFKVEGFFSDILGEDSFSPKAKPELKKFTAENMKLIKFVQI